MKNVKKRQKRVSRLCGVLAVLVGSAVAVTGANAVKASADEASKGVRTVASYFSDSGKALVRTNVDTPSYVKQERNGVLVESQEGGTIVYENLIATDDLTKDDLLVDVQLTPKNVGVREFKQLLVRLEDSVDSKCFVEISLYRYPWDNETNQNKLTCVSVKTNTIAEYKGLFYTMSKTTGFPAPYVRDAKNQGSQILASFTGAMGSVSNSIPLYYDNAEHAIYTKHVNDASYNSKEYEGSEWVDDEGRFLVLDLDNPNHMGTQKTNLWTGFPSGKAKMTFTTQELENGMDTARYTILTIDNQTMDGTYLNDTTAPDIFVDTKSYDEENLPKAQVGKYYPFLGATATDKMYGEIDVIKRLYKDGEEQYVTGDGFVPTTAGEYRLDYIAYDGNRNKTERSFHIVAEDDAAELNGTFVQDNSFALWNDANKNEDGKFETALYYPVSLPAMTGEGGRGRVNASVSVTYNGKKIALQKNTFIPERIGDYEVTYRLTDYVGSQKEYRYVISVSYLDVPELEKPVLPDFIPVGRTYCFPAVQANFYSLWQQALPAYTKITVYKEDGETVLATFENGERAVFNPQTEDGNKIVVEYLAAASETEETVTYRKEIVLSPFDKLSDLFVYGDGVTLTNGSSDMRFTFADDSQLVKFINALSIYDGLNLTFTIPGGEENFEFIEFILRDKINEKITLSVKLYKDADYTYVSLNNGEKKAMTPSYVGGGNFKLSIRQNGSVYDSEDNLVVSAADFDGFASGFVYADFTLQGVTDTATIGMKNIKNQSMINAPVNFIKPSLTVFSDVVGTALLNEKIVIPGAIASDVYDGYAKISVTIKCGENTLYSYFDEFGTFDGAGFQPVDYGTYIVNYEAEDYSGNKLSKPYNIVVRDIVRPTIEIKGDKPTSGTVGKALQLPNAIAHDNVDLDLQVYVVVINPMNAYTLFKVGDAYVPQYEGRYIVKYYCEDSNYNTVYSEEFVIQVGKK